jgi:hypothetical protein
VLIGVETSLLTVLVQIIALAADAPTRRGFSSGSSPGKVFDLPSLGIEADLILWHPYECGYEGDVPQGWGNLKPEEIFT